MDFRSHPSADFNLLLDRLIVIQSGGNLMGSKRHMRKRIGWSLRGLAVQKNSRTRWITLNRERGDFLTLRGDFLTLIESQIDKVTADSNQSDETDRQNQTPYAYHRGALPRN